MIYGPSGLPNRVISDAHVDASPVEPSMYEGQVLDPSTVNLFILAKRCRTGSLSTAMPALSGKQA